MPELPEVETTCRGLAPHCTGQRIVTAVVRNPKLRWPIPANLAQLVAGQPILGLTRRAKYLIMALPHGSIILHLGMSGSLRIMDNNSPAGVHDHIDLVLGNGTCIRLRDPRRFGAVLWTQNDVLRHPLLENLGPEPFSELFDGHYLHSHSRGRKVPIKTFLMDNHVVVGVGNIYANEALFHAGIRPTTPAGRVSLVRYVKLAAAIRTTLERAIEAGGSTLRDFVNSSGEAGYFQQQYMVYGRTGESCRLCTHGIKHIRQGQRSTFFCQHCQT
ncbi:MAG: bifunctional DNA-formamidopyrimidine glycosylase/DNA-(apurinic or apyrimidinic site) lyase [Sulfuriferula sp.]